MQSWHIFLRDGWVVTAVIRLAHRSNPPIKYLSSHWFVTVTGIYISVKALKHAIILYLYLWIRWYFYLMSWNSVCFMWHKFTDWSMVRYTTAYIMTILTIDLAESCRFNYINNSVLIAWLTADLTQLTARLRQNYILIAIKGLIVNISRKRYFTYL